ncbi:MFS transporter [Arenibacter algicola]|uniref:MFS transporter n=1 Tax=Arenibacter algicola TaxID=616991 RepID=UPI001C07B065|nr:MFS transporter [Arenibacter algicola]MBU2904088.1 MFS transporter [Arenibacter algicola]
MNQRKIKNYRWVILTLLVTATIINYLDRQLIGLLKPILEVEFDWSETDYGYIIMAFTGAYAIGLVSWGWLTDRIGAKLGYTLSVASWSIMGILHSLARSTVGFGLARIGLGITEGGNTPAGMKTIAEWFPKKERGLAAGMFNAGTSAGTILALLLVPWILSVYGWHEVFIITGSLGFIWLIFWLFFYDTPAKQKRLTTEEYSLIHEGQPLEPDASQEASSTRWLKLFTFPQTWAFITGKILIDPIYWFFMFWLPSYFSSIFNLDMSKLSLELIIIYTATIIGSVGGGYFSSWLIKRGWSTIKARKTALLIFAVLALTLFFTPFATNVWIVVGIISFVLAVHQAWSANMFTLVTDMFPKQAVSSVTGIGAMSGAIGGMFFPILVGYVLDIYKESGNLAGGYSILFFGCGLTYLMAWIIIQLLTRKSSVVELSDLT